ATVASIKQVLAEANAEPGRISGIGLTGQMHGLVLLDDSGTVLRPAILWNDQRCAAECDEIHTRVGRDRLIARTGKPALAGFTAPKILWVRAHEPAVFSAATTMLLPKDFVRYRLSGRKLSDVADASGTSLFDVGERRWSDEIVDALEVPRAWLPEVTESPVISSAVSADGAAVSGLLQGTPVVAGAGDQAAEAVGCGIVDDGAVSVTIGTSGVVFAATRQMTTDTAGLLHAYCHAAPGLWHIMGVMLSAGGSLRWYRDTIGGEPYDKLTAAAAAVPAGCEGLLFLPYLTGERTPHADPLARGAFVGLTLRHGKAHLTRAVLEGVTFGLKDSLLLVRELGVDVSRVRVSGGGARSAMWRQLMADVFNLEVVTVNVTQGAAFGAALLAGVGIGAWPGVVEATRAVVRETDSVSPGADAAVYQDVYLRYRKLYPALAFGNGVGYG
ncbi:MAG: xylulokinase, partial [Phycisphaerales bacterium]